MKHHKHSQKIYLILPLFFLALFLPSQASAANGSCGTAVRNFNYAENWPNNYTYCAVGEPNPTYPLNPPSGGNSTWNCLGTNGGNTSGTCKATRSAAPINGACGTAERTYEYPEKWPNDYTYCAAGTPSPSSPANPPAGGKSTWTCNGLNSGTNSAPCRAARIAGPTKGVCGKAVRNYAVNESWPNGYSFCSVGDPTPAQPGNPYTGDASYWTCSGINGGASSGSCKATRTAVATPTNAYCGTAVRTYLYDESWPNGSTYCSSGTPNPTAPSNPAQGGTSSWTCLSKNGGQPSNTCRASRATKPTPINGLCGPINGKSITFMPEIDLCINGFASTVVLNGTTKNYTWSCSGTNGGTKTECSAHQYLPPAVNNIVAANELSPSKSGKIIKLNTSNSPTIYYLFNGIKYPFINKGTYSTWGEAIGDPQVRFITVQRISQKDFDAIPLGGNITVKPGNLIIFNDSPHIYVVANNGKLYRLNDEKAWVALYQRKKPFTIPAEYRKDYYNQGVPLDTLSTTSEKPQ